MFHSATSFNINIYDWDVSKGTNFVSIPLICKELNLILHSTWILTIDVSSNNHCLHFSIRCLPKPLTLNKIYITGTFIRAETLWVILWPVKNLILFDIIHEYSSLMYHPTITFHVSALYVSRNNFLQPQYRQLGCF